MMKSPLAEAPTLEKSPASPWAGDVHVFPTTLAQRRFWYYDREDPGNPAYNIAVRMRLAGPLDVAALRRAANEVVRRHEMLRTVFAEEDGEPVQLIAPSLTIPVPLVDLRDLPEDSRRARAEAMAVEEARGRFELAAGPLIRMKLLRLGDQEHVLLVTVHQTVSDCWSIGTISHELGALYGAFSDGQESPLPGLPIQYGDYAVWQKRWLEDHGLGGQLEFWKRRLAGLPPLEVPTDHPRPPRRTTDGEIRSSLLPTALTEALKGLSHREGCTFFMLSLAALKVLLQRLTGEDDVYAGTITAGRTRVEMEPLIGRFINPLVIRADLSGDPTFLDHLAHVRERVLEALDNRDIPYECVVEALAPEPDPSRHPVFQVNFVHQRAFVRPLKLTKVSLSGIPSKSAGAIYDLYFFMVERAEGWRLSCEYNCDLYDAETVEGMMAHYRAILEGVAADPSRRISALPRPSAGDAPPAIGDAPAPAPAPPAARPFVAPRTPTEAKLAGIWREVIQADRVSVTSDFFDEGGHSVLAARILHRVEKSFGKRLSLSAFLRAPTIERLARWIDGDDRSAAAEGPIALREGPGPTLFLVHDGCGETLLYRGLAYRLPEGAAVYAIEPLGDDRSPILHTRIEEMAAYYIGQMRRVQPRGPYALGGECLGGTLAFEMALQLEARGEVVSFVALFDAADPRARKRVGRTAGRRWTSFSRGMTEPRSGPLLGRVAERARTLAIKVSNMAFYSVASRARRFTSRARFLELRAALDAGRPAPKGSHGLSVGATCSLALRDYAPERLLKAPAILFRATQGDGPDEPYARLYADPHLGWDHRLASPLEVCDMPGGHSSMLREPHVGVMSERIAALLRDAHAAAPGRA